MAAPRGARAVAGGRDEAAELADRDFVARHREAAVEAHVVRGPLGVPGVGFAVTGAHAEPAVRHHDHLRPAPAAVHRVGERLAGAEQAVMRGQVDALAQFRGGRIARLGDAQHVGQPRAPCDAAAR